MASGCRKEHGEWIWKRERRNRKDFNKSFIRMKTPLRILLLNGREFCPFFIAWLLLEA